MRSVIISIALAVGLSACSQGFRAASPAPSATITGQAAGAPAVRRPPTGVIVWDWQIGAAADVGIVAPKGAALLDLDGFNVSAQKVAAFKAQGIYTVCYINAGSFEPYRPDAGRYPASLKLEQDPDWPDEYFLDVRDVFRPNSVLAAILTDRFKMCKAKGFDALEPDNLQNDENLAGGQISRQAQIDFNGWVADAAHAAGLAVFQKNGPDKILLRDRTGQMMVDKFDGILNEECQQFSECGPLGEYVRRGKLALNVEYSRTPNCARSKKLQINTLRRDLALRGAGEPGYKRQACP